MSRDVVNLDSTESQPTPAIVPVGIDAVGLLCGAEQGQRARIRFRHVHAIGSGTCRPDLPEGARQEPALDKGAIVPFDLQAYPVAEPRRLGAHVLPSVTARRHLDVAQMELETEAPFAEPLSQGRRRREVLRKTRCMRVEKDEQLDFIPVGEKLLGGLVGHESSKGRAAETVGTAGLKLADLLDVVLRHLLDALVTRTPAVETLRLQAIHWLIRIHVPADVLELEDVPADSVEAIEGGSGAAGSDGDQRRPPWSPAFLSEDRGELLDGWRLEQRDERQSLAGERFHFADKTDRGQRVAAEVEETVPNSDRLRLENVFPDIEELPFQGVSRRGGLRTLFRA